MNLLQQASIQTVHFAGAAPYGTDACGRTENTSSQPSYKPKFVDNKFATAMNLTSGVALFISFNLFECGLSDTTKSSIGTEISVP